MTESRKKDNTSDVKRPVKVQDLEPEQNPRGGSLGGLLGGTIKTVAPVVIKAVVPTPK